VLAWTPLPTGGWVLASRRRLVVATAAATDADAAPEITTEVALQRWPWHEVAQARWDPEQARLDLRLAAGEPLSLAIDGHEPLLRAVRERVTGSTVAIRRHSDDGGLFVQVVADAGVGDLRPEVAAQVEALRQRLAEQVGLRL
jgi:hypothetical protein